MLNENVKNFLQDVKARPEINSNTFFWSVKGIGVNEKKSLTYNYPSRITGVGTFSSRLIAKLCVNQLKKRGLLDENSKNIVMNALPSYTQGESSGIIETLKMKRQYRML